MSENPPAFPNTGSSTWGLTPTEGMTLRDYIAAKVIAAMASTDRYDPGQATPEQRARLAYIEADAMLAARQTVAPDVQAMQHVAYFDEGRFHWMSGIAPRDCELFAPALRAKASPVLSSGGMDHG